MGNDISTHRSTQQNSKQSKKWRLPSRKYKSKRDREKRHNVSLDLDITDPARTMKSPVMSWNCHRKLENIKKNVISVQSNVDKIKSFEQQQNLVTELNIISNDLSQTIKGITHNYLDILPNERSLLDYWTNTMQSSIKYDDNDGIGVIIFEIASMDKIHEQLGWDSGDKIIIKTGEKIGEYCKWYSSDYSVKFKLFHPDFALNEFIVLTTCTDDAVIEDLCDCILIDVARSVKCFFQETTLWCGYVTNSKYLMQETKNIAYNFRSWYEKAKCALKEAMTISKYPNKHSDRIRKWLSPVEKLAKGRKISDIIHSYYTSNHIRYRNDNNESDESIEVIDIDDAISQIDLEMKSGADLNYYDKVGNTPLIYAISTKNTKLIEYLLQFDIDYDHKNGLGRTVLISALKNNISETICCILAQRTKYPNVPDNRNMTPFVWALNYGYFKVMNILSKKGCMDYKNWIISCCMEDQEIALSDILRNNGIIFSAKLDNIGRNILHYAVLHQAYNSINMCLKNRFVHADSVDNNGWSPLHYAAAKNYIKCIKLLMKYDSDIFLKTSQNLLAIDIAQQFNKIESAKLLYNYQIEAKKRLQKIQLSISNESRLSLDDDNDQFEDSTGSSDNDQYDSYENEDVNWNKENENWNKENENWNKENEDWNKENEDMNRNRGNSNSKSVPSSNSENIYEPTHNTYKNKLSIKPNVSVINESDSGSGSDSNKTRIIHDSFSDEIEQALIKNNEYEYEYQYNENNKNGDNSISNEWN
eukprot:220374_1